MAATECPVHELLREDDWFVHERALPVREWVAPRSLLEDETHGPPLRTERPVTPRERSLTGAQLLELLERLPSPGEEFLAAVEEAIENRPIVAPSPWES